MHPFSHYLTYWGEAAILTNMTIGTISTIPVKAKTTLTSGVITCVGWKRGALADVRLPLL